MKKSAQGNPNSNFHPTIDHIRPLSHGGKDVKENLILCHAKTNEEKNDHFPRWKANGQQFHAERTKGTSNEYTIVSDQKQSGTPPARSGLKRLGLQLFSSQNQKKKEK